ncbi:sensor histidine kinase [Paenibacillus sp. R14(2021)]|uniref:sensor histidine kinase n=1 Tax=Paenibacillus sp. R14(2021) TaxID=2859228 RepID=UPI002157FABB|nr:sensor histidine kinase [Paenibacillus sp. R14(2021)]
MHFSSSTNLKDLVGRRLVTNKISAIFELVKNAFDADADEVKVSIDPDGDELTIWDDGDGMSLDDIRNKWMVIGTDNKRGRNSTDKGRPLNGEKGIGRFSVDRLGKNLELISRKENSKQTVSMLFDWGKFEDQKDKLLSDIEIDYSVNKILRKKKGVTLKITGLRDLWTKTEVESLEKRLKGMLSPFSNFDTQPFKIILDCKKYGFDNKTLEAYQLSDISSLWVELSVPLENQNVINLEVYRNGALIEEHTYNNKYSIGPVRTIIYSFDQSDKVSFYHKFKDNVKDYGNIRIYRDYFQIYPYGESNNDWLDLDIRKSQGHYRFLGSRDIIGFIQIYREYNPMFIDATNRQGLEENESLTELRNFVKKEAMIKLEEYFFLKRFKAPEGMHVQHRAEISGATKELNIMAKEIKKFSPELAQQVVDLSKLIREKNQEQDKIIRNQLQLVEVYKRMASKETLLHGIIHQVLIRLQNIETAVWNQKSDLAIYMADEHLNKLFNEYEQFTLSTLKEINTYLLDARNYLLKKRERIEINIYQQLEKIFQTSKYSLIKENISYSIQGPVTGKLKVDLNDLKVIFDNLISNSRKALSDIIDNRKKEIQVVYEMTATKLNIIFRDNGVGIEESDIPHIFSPFFTTREGGFGMGLSIVDELVKSNYGEIHLIKSNIGAAFQISFDLEE